MRLGLAALILLSLSIPIANELAAQSLYRLDDSTIHLVGATNPNLARKFTFDPQHDQWQFNREGIKPVPRNAGSVGAGATADALAAMRAQLGGGGSKSDSLYSVNLPTDGKKGVTYYDNNTDLSFAMVPQFDVRAGQVRDGRLIYPFQDGGKLIYTAKNNGMKEDIVLPRNIGDELHFSYKLELPQELEARLLDDGAVGVFSGDPTLYGNINYATDQDQAKVENARKAAQKDHLLFAIPPPVIRQSGSAGNGALSFFHLDGDTLTVFAKGLSQLSYPISVDPSVVVTSSNDFATGNNEGNIDYSTTGQIGRGRITGGSIGSWAAGTSMPNARQGNAAVTYNGYVYTIGGFTPGWYENDVSYAALGSDGSLGSWTPTTSFTTGRSYFTAAAYNGYLYVMGGQTGSSTYANSVEYAPIKTDGSLGAWATTTNFANGRADHKGLALNGYMYISGGVNSTTEYGDVQYAPINANGTLGAWSSTTSFGGGNRDGHGMVAANGYMYIVGGVNTKGGGSLYNTVQYAHINTDGTLGPWMSTTNMTANRSDFATVIYNGYVYVFGGYNGSSELTTVEYAPINASGTLGAWSATSSISGGKQGLAAAANNGYLYVLGGVQGGAVQSTVQYAKVNPPGVTSSYTATTALGTARKGAAVIAYNGYLYAVGGMTSTTAATTAVNYAAINSDGTVGTWGTTTALTTARGYHYATAYNGYMYVVGGKTGSTTTTNTVYYSKINANGTVGTWTSTTAFTNARQWLAGTVYAGYMYITGGDSNDTGTQYGDVRYAAINANGTIGTWSTTTSLPQTRESMKLVASGGYMYLVGGWNNVGNTYYNAVQYAPINANGTIGIWTATTSFTTGREDHALEIYNGYMYIFGGQNSSGQLSDVQYAPINANGTVGTWSSNTSMTATRIYFGSAIYNGNVYFGGGQDSGGTILTTVQYASINNGGNGAVGAWTDDTDLLPGRMNQLASVAYNGYLYIVGGSVNGTAQNKVLYSKINDDGSIGAWTTDTHTFTNGRVLSGAVAYNGYLYVIGGYNGSSTYYNDVQYAPIGSSGALSSNFASTTNFATSGRQGFGAGAYNGYMYVVGGWDGSTDIADTRYAPINANGTLGAWSSSSSFTGGRSGHAVFIYNGYIYMGGGYGATITNDVQYAPLNANGTVGTWKYTSAFHGVRWAFTMGAYDGYAYLVGGAPIDGTYVGETTVQFAPINANGTLGTWQHTTPLPTGSSDHGGAIYNGYIYRVAGDEGGTGFTSNDVTYASLNTIARAGQYSKLIDLGSGASHNITSIGYNGVLNGSSNAISFRLANGDGVLGALRQNSSLTSTAPNCTITDLGRYVWLSVLFDDSLTAAYPDIASQSNVTDVTVNYNAFRPSTDVRMRNGKFFDNGSLRPYDTCAL